MKLAIGQRVRVKEAHRVRGKIGEVVPSLADGEPGAANVKLDDRVLGLYLADELEPEDTPCECIWCQPPKPTGIRRDVELTGMLFPWDGAQPVFLAVPNSSLLYLPCFDAAADLVEVMARARVPFAGIKQIEDSPAFLSSFGPAERAAVRVMVNPYFTPEGLVRWGEMKWPGNLINEPPRPTSPRVVLAPGRRMGPHGAGTAGLAKGAEATLALLRAWLEANPDRERPRFRFPPRDIAVLGSMKDIGYRLALNETARELVAGWLELKEALGLNDYATVMMVRTALDMTGIEWETCGLTDLGLSPMGGGGRWQ